MPSICTSTAVLCVALALSGAGASRAQEAKSAADAAAETLLERSCTARGAPDPSLHVSVARGAERFTA
jgi:hypothetical protein